MGLSQGNTPNKTGCLGTQRIHKKWTLPIQNWGRTIQQPAVRFGVTIDRGLQI